MRIFTVLILALSVAGCSWFTKKTGCELGKAAAGAGTVAIGAVLGCTGTDAMVADIQALLLEKTSICAEEAPASGTVADLVCPSIGEYAIKTALNKLPKTWGCSGSVLTDAAKSQIVTYCKQALPY